MKLRRAHILYVAVVASGAVTTGGLLLGAYRVAAVSAVVLTVAIGLLCVAGISAARSIAATSMRRIEMRTAVMHETTRAALTAQIDALAAAQLRLQESVTRASENVDARSRQIRDQVVRAGREQSAEGHKAGAALTAQIDVLAAAQLRLQESVTRASENVDARSRQIRDQVVKERRSIIASANATSTALRTAIGQDRNAILRSQALSSNRSVALHDAMRLTLQESVRLIGELAADTAEGIGTIHASVAEASLASETRNDKLTAALDQLLTEARRINDSHESTQHIIQELATDTAGGIGTIHGSVAEASLASETRNDKLTAALDQLLTEARRIKDSHESTQHIIQELATDTAEGIGTIHGSVAEASLASETRNDKLTAALDQLSIADLEELIRKESIALRAYQRSQTSKAITAMRTETQQTEALLQLLPSVSPRWLMPSLGRWAIDPRNMLHLTQILKDYKPRTILEIGGGTSTIWLGYLTESYGTDIISIDHSEEFLEITRDMVKRHGLESSVTTRLAPLKDCSIDDRQYQWYDQTQFSNLGPVDLLFIDGPPGSTGPDARYPALPILRERLVPGSLIILDDSARPEEQHVLELWLSEFPELSRIHENISGLAVLEVMNDRDEH